MGIDLWSLKFLLEARERTGGFGRLLQIGRQELHIGQEWHHVADGFLRDAGLAMRYIDATRGGRYADEGLLQTLGASEALAADASAYEDAALVHDFNDPIDPKWHQSFDTVFDGGSLEHIFNVPGTLANEMKLVKVGGHIISAVPSNNWLGHGFYQFSPELPYRVFTPPNGFRMMCAFLTEMRPNHELYEVEDLARRAGGEIGTTNTNTNLLFIAKKTAHVKPFQRWPQQGDYQSAWEGHDTAPTITGDARPETKPSIFARLLSRAGR